MTSPEQSMRALALGQEVRLNRAVMRRELKAMPRPDAMQRTAAFVIDPPPWAETWEVGRLLRCIPRFGKVKSQQACNHIHALPTRRLRDLSPRQREQLAVHLTKRTTTTKGTP